MQVWVSEMPNKQMKLQAACSMCFTCMFHRREQVWGANLCLLKLLITINIINNQLNKHTKRLDKKKPTD